MYFTLEFTKNLYMKTVFGDGASIVKSCWNGDAFPLLPQRHQMHWHGLLLATGTRTPCAHTHAHRQTEILLRFNRMSLAIF